MQSKDNKQRFLKARRVTEIERILETKKFKLPGPQDYELKSLKKSPYLPFCKDSPQTTMYYEATHRGSQTPGCKYDPNWMFVKDKTLSCKISPDSGKDKNGRMVPIKKDKTKPCFGSYQTSESFTKTQTSKLMLNFTF